MDDADALRQQLRDEAAWRAFVEDELAREAEKARIWRDRAEERAARIDRLVGGRSLRQALVTRLAGPAVPSLHLPDEAPATGTAATVLRPGRPRGVPAWAEVRAGTLVASVPVAALAAELDQRDLDELGADGLRDVDLGVIDAAGWQGAPQLHAALLAWLADVARPPVAWFGTVASEVDELLVERDVVVDAGHARARTVELAPWGVPVPDARVPRVGLPGRWVEDDSVAVLVTTKGAALATVRGASAHRALGLALSGVPVLDGDGRGPYGLPDPEQPLDLAALDAGAPVPEAARRLGIRQRRHAAATATAARAVDDLLGALAVPRPDHRPRLAVLLSSNRPQLVPDQLAALAAQLRRPDEVRIALHGGTDAAQRRAVEAAGDAHGLRVHVSTPSAEVSLGSVLNDLADATGAELLAKVDDDDHYGPAHLVDAEAALLRTGADLVGKKAHYVHLSGEGRTWLLAEDAEDSWVEQGLMGATFVWRHGLLDTVRFSPRPRRVDSLYVRAAAAAGARLYALPANDFAYVRDPGGRTNVAGAAYVRARGRDVGPGLPRAVIDV